VTTEAKAPSPDWPPLLIAALTEPGRYVCQINNGFGFQFTQARDLGVDNFAGVLEAVLLDERGCLLRPWPMESAEVRVTTILWIARVE